MEIHRKLASLDRVLLEAIKNSSGLTEEQSTGPEIRQLTFKSVLDN